MQRPVPTVTRFTLLISIILAGGFSEPGWAWQQPDPPSGSSNSAEGSKSAEDWLTGQGKDLAFRISGSVYDQTGTAVSDAKVYFTLNMSDQKIPRQAEIDDRQFRFDVPAAGNWHTVSVFAIDSTGFRHAARIIRPEQIRSIARDGLKLNLKPAKRELKFQAVYKGQPVSDANIFLRLSSGCRLNAKTDSKGFAKFRCLPDLTLYQVTAWKEKQLIGGYSFRRKPERDPLQDDHKVELSTTRKQQIVFVDEQDRPVGNLRFRLNVGTPAPLYNFMATDEQFEDETDAGGKATIAWFPDWPKASLSLFIPGGKWVMVDSSLQLEDGIYRVRLKPSTARQRITGRINSKMARSLGGVNVVVSSFQAERENTLDRRRVFSNPDGTFSVDVLPGSTYCIYANDLEWVSDPFDAILFDPKKNNVVEPEITLIRGEKVRVVVTQGPLRRPYANVAVDLASDHDFSWIENGEKRQGSIGKRTRVYSDKNGIAEAFVTQGRLDVRVTTDDWRYSSNLRIGDKGEGQVPRVNIHRPIVAPIQVSGKLSAASDPSEIKFAKVKGRCL